MHSRNFFDTLKQSKKAAMESRILTFNIEGYSCLDLLQKLQKKIAMPTMVEGSAGERIACSDPSV